MLTRPNFYGFSEVSFSSFAIRIRHATRNPRLAPSTKQTRPTHTTILIPPSILFHILPYFRCHFAAFCVEDRDLLAAFFFWTASLAGPRHRVRPHTRHTAMICRSSSGLNCSRWPSGASRCQRTMPQTAQVLRSSPGFSPSGSLVRSEKYRRHLRHFLRLLVQRYE